MIVYTTDTSLYNWWYSSSMNDGEFINYYIAKIIDFRDER